MQFEITGKDDPITSKEKEIQDMQTDHKIFIKIESDFKDVERDFAEDPALQSFKVKYEVIFPFNFQAFVPRFADLSGG
jgi:hypothetical protein